MTTKKIAPTKSAYNYQLLIKNILNTPLIYSPDQKIVYRDILQYSYSELKKRVNRLANMLEKLGVKPGDTVAVMDWDSHRYLECFFAIPMMGAVLHTINIRLTSEQLIYTINHAEDDVILVNEEFVPLLESVKDKFETVKKVILLSDNQKQPESGFDFAGEYEALVSDSSDEYVFPDFDENTMATTFYTTGTTGLPKGVFFSHRQIVLHTYGAMAGLCAYKSQANINSSDVYMPMTPMFHVHAWGMPYLMTLLGAKQVYPGRYEPEMLLKLIVGEKVTFSHCVPTIMNMLVTSPSINSVDLKGWKVIIGGSALSKGLCKEALKHGINLYTGYGMSETCPLLTLANIKPHMLEWSEEDQIDIRCKTGLPMPNVHLEIVDPKGNPLPHDGKTAGEVVARTPWLTQGYLKDEAKSEELWENGWLHTGDIGLIDSEGYLKITDRLKDVIKTGGEWVSSLEIEDIISQHEGVNEVAVVGIVDEKWGERPLAMVVLKEGYQNKVTEIDIMDFCMTFVEKGIIPKYGIPSKIIMDKIIPKTSVGKISKKDIRAQYN
ncbi:MAG: fatty acid--CoA ligase [Proteobacteria bacterium]|nr:fatty acid--CoA ligase [Pseudomonadota bacterium]MBU1388444.1 fatty acid--CoA ligase [Pseudomonadota bacterium]MBU1542732.1 fatty acid--CoA ligase [Pseudomonadota bacterium]MBU2429474.1 fatty acid--CoA ligase [Pseudomonadota bacterium]MBU2481266.1 fatty acid--CoA ligase [Pseudomonadota bacterium]